MSTRQMLSFDEELALSDKLVARRAVLDLCETEEREPTAEEAEVIEAGRKAAAELVEAYSPYIYHCAEIVYRKCLTMGHPPTGISREDLANEGFEAAMRCTNRFNTRRDPDGTWKLRFARYSSMAIFKAMNMYLLRMSTPYRIDLQLVQMSLAFQNAEKELAAERGPRFHPTDQEIADRAGVDLGRVKSRRLDVLPYRERMLDVEGSDAAQGRAPVVEILSDEDSRYASVLSDLVSAAFEREHTQIILKSFLGLDRGYARDAFEVFEDVGEEVALGRRKIAKIIEIVRHALIHPHYRVIMCRRLSEAHPGVFEEFSSSETA